MSTRAEIARLHRSLGTTMIYVTHDQVEAMTLGQRIVVLDKGVIQQIDAPMSIYERPVNLFVAGFIGNPAMNFCRGRLRGGVIEGDGVQLRVPGIAARDGQEVVAGEQAEDAARDPERELGSLAVGRRAAAHDAPLEHGRRVVGIRAHPDGEGRAVDGHVVLDRPQRLSDSRRSARRDTERAEDLQSLARPQPAAEVPRAGGLRRRFEHSDHTPVADERVVICDRVAREMGTGEQLVGVGAQLVDELDETQQRRPSDQRHVTHDQELVA